MNKKDVDVLGGLYAQIINEQFDWDNPYTDDIAAVRDKQFAQDKEFDRQHGSSAFRKRRSPQAGDEYSDEVVGAEEAPNTFSRIVDQIQNDPDILYSDEMSLESLPFVLNSVRSEHNITAEEMSELLLRAEHGDEDAYADLYNKVRPVFMDIA